MGFVFRGQYNYADKYLVEFSGRYDGSYKFIGNVSGRRWGFFPSVSLGWRMSEEGFFAPLRKAVDNFKLRASFGSLGDDNGSAAYAFLSTFTNVSSAPSVVLGGAGQNGIMTSLVANELLTWERNHSYNVGFDLAMWNGRLGVEFDAFYNYIFDILGSNSGKPSVDGRLLPDLREQQRAGRAGHRRPADPPQPHRQGFPVRRHRQSDMGQGSLAPLSGRPNTPDYAKRIGNEPLHDDGLHRRRAFPERGGDRPLAVDFRLAAAGRRHQVQGPQRRRRDHLRPGPRLHRPRPAPAVQRRINLNASWKGLEFDILFIGAAVCDVSLTGTYYNHNEDNTIFTRPFKAGANSPRYLVEQAWTPRIPTRNIRVCRSTRPTRTTPTPRRSGTATASTASKSVHLGYTLPKAWTGKLRIQKVKVYVEGNNLCTWSGLPEGIDPEWPGVTNGYYPQQRTVVGGLEISF